ncbi:hypothetical protein Tco_0736890 [Tanacetum coccineum]
MTTPTRHPQLHQQTEAQATIVSTTEPSPTVLLRLSELEKKVEAYSKVDHSEILKRRSRSDRERIPSRSNEKRTAHLLTKCKTQPMPSSTDKICNAEEPVHNDANGKNDQPVMLKRFNLNVDDGPEQTWFNDLVNAEKDPLTFDDLMATPIDFTKFAMNRLKKDKITKADLVGPVYKLLKGTCRSSIELEYNMEQCYLALSDQLDWANPEGDRCPYD